MVGGPLDHFFQDGSIYIGQRDNLLILNRKISVDGTLQPTCTNTNPVIHAQVLQHCLDGDGLLSYLHVNWEDLSVRGLQLD